MENAFGKSNLKVEVGIDFEPHTDQLLEYCKSFSANSGAAIRLTHAVEPWKEHPWITTYPGVNYYSLAKEAEESSKNDADMQLIGFSQKLQGFKTESNVAVGPIPEVLQADAMSSGCSLVLLGVRSKVRDYKLMPNGFSTVLSLLSHAKVPTMVIPQDCTNFKKRDRLRVVFADDFSENCKSPLQTAVNFATGLQDVDLFHLHVSDQSHADIRETGEKIQDMMNLGKIPFDSNFSIDEFSRQAQDRMKSMMSERVGKEQHRLEVAGCQYHSQVVYGDITESLKEVVRDIDPDIVFFGRHEAIHTNPLKVGKVPFWTILSLNRPIVVAPPHRVY